MATVTSYNLTCATSASSFLRELRSLTVIKVESYFCSKMGTDFIKVTPDTEYHISDARYVDGAIEVIIGDIAIFDKNMWDLVDQLWAYVINALVELKATGSASSYFPDQPLKFTFERVGGNMIRASSHPPDTPRVAVVDESSFIAALMEAGLLFYDVMTRLVPQSTDLFVKEATRLRSLC